HHHLPARNGAEGQLLQRGSAGTGAARNPAAEFAPGRSRLGLCPQRSALRCQRYASLKNAATREVRVFWFHGFEATSPPVMSLVLGPASTMRRFGCIWLAVDHRLGDIIMSTQLAYDPASFYTWRASDGFAIHLSLNV